MFVASLTRRFVMAKRLFRDSKFIDKLVNDTTRKILHEAAAAPRKTSSIIRRNDVLRKTLFQKAK